jgi:saccharopine dehydrogenase-like NADP-dependent oxidoreductase
MFCFLEYFGSFKHIADFYTYDLRFLTHIKMKKVVVLGAGLVGKAMAIDLSKNFDVTSVDINESALSELSSVGIKTQKADLSNNTILSALIQQFDLVVGAVPGFMGFETCKTVIEAGKNMVDISFFPEDPFLLDELAKKNNVTIVTDCGVAPGMGNIILGYHNQKMKITSYECLVGGLPIVREWPYEYKAVFSPIDVIEEYTRPARYVQNGMVVVKEALSDAELVHFEEVGTLESWNSDGLRSLIRTMAHIPHMIEKTLRYPGCIEYLRVLRETGFFSHEEMEVNGITIKPIDLTAKLLFPKWKLKPGEEEFTIMRIRIAGEENGQQRIIQYNLYDRTEKSSGILSMARTTGYTCTATAHLVLDGKFDRKGINPPEYLGEDENNFRFVINYLKERGVQYRVN